LYDQRVARCQRFMPPPSDRIVHLDIDDNTLAQVGRWPWHRDVMAEILEEVRRTEPKVLAMDVLFAEPEEIAYDRTGKPIDRDAVLTETVRGFGRVLIPSSFTLSPPPPSGSIGPRVAALLTEEPDLTVDQCVARLRADGINITGLDDAVRRSMLAVRPDALYERVWRELDGAPSTGNEPAPAAKQYLKHKIFPRADAQFTGSVLERLFVEEYERVIRERALRRFTLPPAAGMPPVLHAYDQITPILPLSEAAAYSAFVNYLPDQSEGTVRSVPLVASYRGRLVPHMGLVAACAMLGIDVHDIRLAPGSITLPRPGGHDIVIPVHTREDAGIGSVGMLMEVPMFGKSGNWQTMYDYPRHQDPVQHISVYEAWRICLTKRRIDANESAADQVMADALGLTDPKAAADYRTAPPRGDAKRKIILETLASMADVITGLASVAAADLGPAEQQLLAKLKTDDSNLRQILKQNDAMNQQLGGLRAELRAKLNDKVLFMGGTATGHTDMFPTALHAICPGVVVHGAVCNAILTGKMWRVAPPYVTILLTAAMGLACGVLATYLSPAKAFFATALLAIGYLLVNGFVLFDYGNWIVGAAGPAFAAGLVWSAITLFDFISEAAERARITARFSNYVDPSLVNWVIAHPEQARFDGESREMSMGFTDLAGFTTLTEQLGERTVKLLAEYMGHMIPIIRANNGYVSRLMGDGIYFFFGAPEPDADHAAHAVSTALAMHEAVDKLNLTLPARGFPPLKLRAGLSSGRVIVGDAGSAEFSDYTALGDSVNTAARLESANKFFGTRILLTSRTIELLNGTFLVRQIANLRVAGKTKGVQVCEPLCRMEAATPEQRRLAELTERMTAAFGRGEFEACKAEVDRLEQAFGPSKLSALYRDLCDTHLQNPSADFDGQIVLTEK
jgi:class 3 adenylate cyclase